MLSVHYRQKLNFTFDSLAAAAGALRRVDEMRFRVASAAERGEPDPGLAAAAARLREEFAAALADDLNAAGALGALFKYVREVNVAVEQGRLGRGDREGVVAALAGADRVLGVLDPDEWRRPAAAAGPTAEEVEERIVARRQARERRDFAAADRIRDELAEAGVILEDTPAGTRWKRR
jgi:cysteinyl-tRNA synthetase